MTMWIIAVVAGFVALVVGWWLFNRFVFDPEHGPLTREFLRGRDE